MAATAAQRQDRIRFVQVGHEALVRAQPNGVRIALTIFRDEVRDLTGT